MTQGESALVAAAAAVALLLGRAVVALLEAALVAVGLPRAQALAADAMAPRRVRALAALLEDREGTAVLVRVVETLAALGAGVLAAFAGGQLAPAGLASALVAVLVAAFLSIVLSAAGRALGARHGEAIALALARPARLLVRAVRPIGAAAAAVAAVLARGKARFALPSPPLEEMERALAEYARSQGTPSDQSTSELIKNVFDFREKVARDVMVPRTEVLAVDIETPVKEILRLLAEEGHSRLPVYRESLDQVIGTLHARDLVPLLEHPELIVLRDIVRPTHFVPWSKPIDQLLREMQKNHIHMGVVVDEYGGVMGICTLEDVLEQIVGAIGDEFEGAERRGVEAHADGTFTVKADTPIEELNRVAGVGIPETSDYETVGGFLNGLAGAIPAAGDRFFHRGWLFTVAEATPRRVLRVRAVRVKRPPGEATPVPAARGREERR